MSRISKYPERIILSDIAHMSIVDLVAIDLETLGRDIRRSLEKEFIKLICINP